MAKIFNYSTFDTFLEQESKSLTIDFTDYLTLECLFELETALAWCSNHIEIQSILLCSTDEKFLEDDMSLYERLGGKSPKLANKYFKKLRKITTSLLYMPQTVVFDLGEGTNMFAAELALGADIRVTSLNGYIEFPHLAQGLGTMAGGQTLLSELIGHAHARNYIMTARPVSAERMFHHGLVAKCYQNRKLAIRNLLMSISTQSQVSRIQQKRAFLESISGKLEHGKEIEEKVLGGILLCKDYQKQNYLEFMSAKEFSVLLKETKGDELAEVRN